ncbi:MULTISPECIES: DUF423 domain-containing protein [unclassified Bacillus (in: firmicutes)]|uniref:DUF423 domain-containing protein n=1 Tax=Bacillus TaxID=1386 RepID=UPI0033906C38
MKLFFILGAMNAMLAVALGAFGAHGLEGKIPEKYIEIWNKGVQYQMFHSIGLFIVAFLADKLTGVSLVPTAGWVMFAGILFFSGSLYVLALTQVKILGAITPIGGVAFITSWVMLVIAAAKHL